MPNGRSAIRCGSTVRVPRSQPPAYGSWKSSSRCISGPSSSSMLRVRRAASTSMAARSRRAGGTSSRSVPPLIQRVRTPMLARTSRMRLTSSMRASRRSTVRPLVRRLAQSSATAAFLLVLTSMAPDRGAPPWTRRCIGPDAPSETISLSSAEPIRASISRLRFWCPRSMRFTALWLVPSTRASSVWVSPRCRRASRMSEPILPRYSVVTMDDGISYMR